MERKRPRHLIANWKMHLVQEGFESYTKHLQELARARGLEQDVPDRLGIAMPFTLIKAASDYLNEEAKHSSAEGKMGPSPLKAVIGAQNMHDVNEGAFTGEISLEMLVESGAKFTLLGHSERRQFFGESDEFIARKVARALEHGFECYLCVGETLTQRNEGCGGAAVAKQLEVVIKHLKDLYSRHDGQADHLEDPGPLSVSTALRCSEDSNASVPWDKLHIAYEPTWAIGSGKSCSLKDIEEMLGLIKQQIKEACGSEEMLLLYGGSVNETNCTDIVHCVNVDGLLVGGASLKSEKLFKIAEQLFTCEAR